MKKSDTPNHLSTEAGRWWLNLSDAYGISDEGGLLLLQTAMEAFDRMRSATSRIEKDGHVILDRFNQPKPHPLLSTERDARAQMLAALKMLNLDIEPLKAIGRPPGDYHFKGLDNAHQT